MAVANDPNALKLGSKIAGYEILRVIGSGGFGITYEAMSPVTGRHVAIKEFFPRGVASREESTRIVFAARDMDLVEWALRRFESSTTEQCRLKHPNIVDVFHYVKDNDTGYMIMEYVEGDTLEHMLRQRGAPLSAEEARPLIEPVFDALEYLHERNLIHRDIAPDNIMIRSDGRPTIIDFGAIKLIEQETQLRSKTNRSFMVSKQFYSPPEQAQENVERLDLRADVYAAAATIYRALAGRPPASAEERTQQIAFGNGDPLQPLGTLAPHLSAQIANAVDRALSFKVSERTPTIAAFRSELGWDDARTSAATIAVSRGDTVGSSVRSTEQNPAALPEPALMLTQKKPSHWRWAAPLVLVATVAGAVLLAGGSWLNLFQARGPSVIVQQPPPVVTRPAPAPQVAPQIAAKPETPAAPAQPPPAAAPPAAAPPTPQTPPDPLAAARSDFELAQRIDTRAAYEEFLKRYPDGYHAQLARAQIKRIADSELRDLAVKLNAGLRRVGCAAADSQAAWSDESKKALNAFNRYAATKFDVSVPSAEALAAVQAKTARVCPLVCGPGQRASGDYCIADCAAGLVRLPNGACARPQQQKQRPVAQPAPQAAPKKGRLVCRPGDALKGEQPHRQVCEVQ